MKLFKTLTAARDVRGVRVRVFFIHSFMVVCGVRVRDRDVHGVSVRDVRGVIGVQENPIFGVEVASGALQANFVFF